MRGPGAHLRRFVEFLGREGAGVITVEAALRWATAATDAIPATWRNVSATCVASPPG
ncbi:MAG: hypothetical protein HC897_18700 [Thermoanaerobaculia bacterium]|nr:hypothetical protein [Thermoanaerobaculia bacterium]